jgi:uncharacterized coiled-coil DUF342 family protein
MTELDKAFIKKYIQFLVKSSHCVDKRCKHDANAYMESSRKYLPDMMKINQDLRSNKITRDEARAQQTKIKEKMASLKEAQNMHECEMKMCKKHLLDVIDFILKESKGACSKDKRFCVNLEEVKAIRERISKGTSTSVDTLQLFNLL